MTIAVALHGSMVGNIYKV